MNSQLLLSQVRLAEISLKHLVPAGPSHSFVRLRVEGLCHIRAALHHLQEPLPIVHVLYGEHAACESEVLARSVAARQQRKHAVVLRVAHVGGIQAEHALAGLGRHDLQVEEKPEMRTGGTL